MTVLDFRRPRDVSPEQILEEVGGDYLEFDELLAGATGDLALDVDGAGALVLVDGGEAG